jgi:flagellar motor component MotA
MGMLTAIGVTLLLGSMMCAAVFEQMFTAALTGPRSAFLVFATAMQALLALWCFAAGVWAMF